MRTIVLTGASDGIGAAAAQQLARAGTRLVLVGRDPDKTRAVAERVGAEHRVADHSRLDDVRELAADLERSLDRIDVLANNAGGLLDGPVRTVDGFELTFQVNHLAPYLLTNLLRHRLIESRASVVATASVGNLLYGRLDLDDIQGWSGFRPNRAYGTAKLANILFTQELHARFHARGVSTVAFHPGIVGTSFASGTGGYLGRVYQGALRKVLSPPSSGGAHLAYFVDGVPGTVWRSGTYYNDRRRPGLVNRAARRPGVAERHFDLSAELLGVDWSIDADR